MTCPWVEIGNALKTDLETARDASSFSDDDFTVRVGFGDFPEELQDDEADGSRLSPHPLVDIILPVQPTMDLIGRPAANHVVTYTIGLRQRLSSAYFKSDGSADVDKIAPLPNLFHELIKWVFPSTSDPSSGSITSTANYHAIWQPPVEIVKVWDPHLLETAKQYCGIFRFTGNIEEAL